MKYIRTKDGIIPDKDKYLQDLDIEQYSMYMQGLLKEANTIEELCDCFVCDKEIYNWFGKELKRDYKEIYGAIWADKGLIYVAKMNDKGELELL